MGRFFLHPKVNIIFIVFFSLGVYLSLFVTTISADFSLSNIPSSVNSDQEVEANVSLSLQGQDNKKYYLEGALKKDDGSNYFGLTFNDSDWVAYSPGSFTNLKPITTDASGTWSGSLRFKVDSTSPYYKGSGNYVFQIKRFTEGGSSSWSDNSVTLTISGSEPEPSPSSSPSSSSPPPAGSISQNGFSVNSDKTSFYSSDIIHLTIQLGGLSSNSKFYLKPALVKSGSTNYFGLTKIGSNWVKNSQIYSEQLPFTSDASGNWSGLVEFKVDPDDSGFTSSGAYILKVGKYSSSGSGPTWSPDITVSITDNTPKASPSSGSGGSTSLNSASPKPSSTATTTSKTTLNSVSSSGGGLEQFSNGHLDKLPKIGTTSGEASKAGSVLVKNNQQINWLVFVFGGGLILVSAASGVAYFKLK
jgi:hypothetical protein